MPRIYDFIEPAVLRHLLCQYSKTLNTAVLLFDERRNFLLSFPEDVSGQGVVIRPLYIRGSLVGHAAIPAPEERYLDYIVENLSIILERGYEIESLSSEVVRNYEEFAILWRLSARLGSVLDVEKACTAVADEIMNVCPSKAVSVLLADNISTVASFSHFQEPQSRAHSALTAQILSSVASVGEYAGQAAQLKLRADRGLVGRAFDKKETLTVCDVRDDKRFEGFPYPVTCLLIAPLIVEDSPIGAIVVSDKLSGEEFYSTDIKIISSIASEGAISVRKASFFSEIRTMLFGVAEAFSLAIEAKDPCTYGHSRRVAELSVKIARCMGIADDVIDWIRLAALLHDIGKIGTPEDILHKGEKLDPDEMTRVREHPLIGAKVIEPIKKLSEVAKWITCHHEKYDGSGYPMGISGDTIPLPSRIISIADIFDALTSDRPYKKSLTREDAVEVMREFVGEYFAPDLFVYFEKAIHTQQ
jgi:putative nucleotidyltransferase with HDIG domain